MDRYVYVVLATAKDVDKPFSYVYGVFEKEDAAIEFYTTHGTKTCNYRVYRERIIY